jgi:hemoglobin-like flavoprotein
MLTPDHIYLVRRSFDLVAPIADDAAALFYAKLFRRDPSLRALFRGDMTEQGRKLMQMIGVAVQLLERPQALQPALQRLGERHAVYGVQPHHYDSVGAALIETLEAGLGNAFDAPTRLAWCTMYQWISETMQEAAQATA